MKIALSILILAVVFLAGCTVQPSTTGQIVESTETPEVPQQEVETNVPQEVKTVQKIGTIQNSEIEKIIKDVSPLSLLSFVNYENDVLNIEWKSTYRSSEYIVPEQYEVVKDTIDYVYELGLNPKLNITVIDEYGKNKWTSTLSWEDSLRIKNFQMSYDEWKGSLITKGVSESKVTETVVKTTQTIVPSCTENWSCTSWSECSDSGTQARKCTDYNFCGTILTKPSESQTCIPVTKTWSSVTGLSGSAGKVTNTFHISGNKWRYTWSCVDATEIAGFPISPGSGRISIFAYPEGETASYVSSVFFAKCTDSPDTTNVQVGSGDYYFDVMVASVQSWSVNVEDYK